jgi:hypothetical protein
LAHGRLGADKPRPRTARSRLVPDDFELTEERLEYAVAQGLSAPDARREFESFRLHEFRDPKTDWQRAWQRWCRTAVARELPALGPSRGPPRPAQKSYAERYSERLKAFRDGGKEALEALDAGEHGQVIDITPKGATQ